MGIEGAQKSWQAQSRKDAYTLVRGKSFFGALYILEKVCGTYEMDCCHNYAYFFRYS